MPAGVPQEVTLRGEPPRIVHRGLGKQEGGIGEWGQSGVFSLSPFLHDGHSYPLATLLENRAGLVLVVRICHDGEDPFAAVLAGERTAAVLGVVAAVTHDLLLGLLAFLVWAPASLGGVL